MADEIYKNRGEEADNEIIQNGAETGGVRMQEESVHKVQKNSKRGEM